MTTPTDGPRNSAENGPENSAVNGQENDPVNGPVDGPEADSHVAHEGISDCSEVLGRVFFFLDNELDQADSSQIQQHLDECGPCLARYDLERTVKTLVARSCTEKAPDGLRQRVLLSLQQVQVQITRTD